MDWKWLLFSSRGRINRAKYWLGLLVTYAVFLVIYVPVIASIKQGEPVSPVLAVMLGVVSVVGLVVAYIGIVLGIKRYHDRDKSGWWILISLVPIIGGFWYFIEAGCLRGTIGRNRFGPDPLQPGDDIVQVFGAPQQQQPIN